MYWTNLLLVIPLTVCTNNHKKERNGAINSLTTFAKEYTCRKHATEVPYEGSNKFCKWSLFQ